MRTTTRTAPAAAARRWWPLGALGVVALVTAAIALGAARANDDTDEPAAPDPATIDRAIERAFGDAVRPSAPVDDAGFLRRVTLDTIGTIPAEDDLARFVWARGERKRDREIDRLLASPEHAAHLAERFTELLIDVEGVDQQVIAYYRAAFRDWLREQLAADRGWDRIAAEIIAAEGRSDQVPPTAFAFRRGQPTAEDLAGATASRLLGIQLECARCHDHPFDRFSQADFHSLAAFFARTRAQPVPGRRGVFALAEVPVGDHRAAVGMDGKKRVLEPRVPPPPEGWDVPAARRPGAPLPEGVTANSRRGELARLMTSADDPYFARATVNRIWSWHFGRGLVEPVDDLSATGDGPHARLLAELARAFAASGFSIRQLERAILRSASYQRAARPADGADVAAARARFATAAVRPLRARDAVSAILRAAGREAPGEGEPEFLHRAMKQRLIEEVERALPPPRAGELPDPDRVTTAEGLFILNGKGPAAVASARPGGALVGLLRALDRDEARVQALYRRTLCRPPAKAELRAALEHVRAGGPGETDPGDAAARRRWEDLFWALLATTEFLTNH